nr:DNA-binding protein [arsenite-oxidising bacterium NT-25]
MTRPLPEVTDVNRSYWDGLAAGQLRYQHCRHCGNNWLPAREHCPQCLSPEPEWQVSSGKGVVVSWIVYHHAYAPHLAARLPYDVTIVELAEGPRILTNIVNGAAGKKLTTGAEVELAIEVEEGVSLPRFRLVNET